MPELPEVETIKGDLAKLIVGKEILDISTDVPKQVQPSLKKVKKVIIGLQIKQVNRRAKILQIILSNNWALIVHLKLTGRLLFRKKNDPPDKWVHVIINLGSLVKGKKKEFQLRFSDSRKFGWIKLVNNQELKKINQKFGPEPLADLDQKTFKKILSSTRRVVKGLLLDQKKIAGIGNIYACDALFLAQIDPRRPANQLSGEEEKSLFQAIEKVLKAGIKYRGASDQYYLDALGHKGSYQDHFLVYGRTGKKCFGCSGKVKRIVVGGRGTFYCPVCQRLKS
ncbi:bifunctional DNA-formamidopyrimidine glycosylase/DNA-(apurinic or apyrimidinic site) lyase [Patescibacteria group bacterium]